MKAIDQWRLDKVLAGRILFFLIGKEESENTRMETSSIYTVKEAMVQLEGEGAGFVYRFPYKHVLGIGFLINAVVCRMLLLAYKTRETE